jgi:soluble lytic murein transglycosylase-like protein
MESGDSSSGACRRARRGLGLNVLAVPLLGASLMLNAAVGPARAQSQENGAAAASQPSGSNMLAISRPSIADDFLARTRVGRNTWLALIAQAAAVNGLPPDFLDRVVAQESGFDPTSVSKAGALGIAQFMPGTATVVGLRDPFDPVEAIPAAAKHLRDLRAVFGNLGLAAAAYNAGAGRVRAWLAGRADLPLETVDYVRAVTGRDASEWAPAGPQFAGAAMSLLSPQAPAVGRATTVRRQKMASTTSLCQAINSASSPCIVQQRY